MTAAETMFEQSGVRVMRLVAPNPGPLTADGTNTYLVVGERAVIIDPGPEIAAHRARLIDALEGDRLDAILVTHPHVDHSAGAPPLAAATGAPIFGAGPHGADISPIMARLAAEEGGDLGGGEGADVSHRPDRRLRDGEALFGDVESVDFRAIATPGHTSTHLAFALEVDGQDLGVVFSGDHVMGWSTSLISPPDGDMSAFMRSLDRLAARRDRLFLPGHGPAIDQPAERLAELTAHRRARRAAIEAALAAGPRRPDEIRASVYAELPPALKPAADRNVLAHLIELVEEGVAELVDPISPRARFRLTAA